MHSFGLRARLLIGALLLTAVPLLIAALVLPPRIETVLVSNGHTLLRQTASDLAVLADHVITQHREVVRGVASIASVADAIHARNAGQLDAAGLARHNDQLGALLSSLGEYYQGLWTSNSDGMIFAGKLKNGDTSAYVALDIRDRAYFTEARRTLKPVISDPVISKIGNVAIQRRVCRTDRAVRRSRLSFPNHRQPEAR
jgi:hypothetical protein